MHQRRPSVQGSARCDQVPLQGILDPGVWQADRQLADKPSRELNKKQTATVFQFFGFIVSLDELRLRLVLLQGVYVLQDNRFRVFANISNSKQFLENAAPVSFACRFAFLHLCLGSLILIRLLCLVYHGCSMLRLLAACCVAH